ncbi:hypothetical protein JOB18_047656 [Solea senegalensis]|uniref:Uncharacterized protein n=1 Tax=Solea senegalensis TaxID=28829 RepID=A0AAV6PFG4_SOLSE|nr:hypothetical protein JOB18_047656 [Solea senegalensis]
MNAVKSAHATPHLHALLNAKDESSEELRTPDDDATPYTLSQTLKMNEERYAMRRRHTKLTSLPNVKDERDEELERP